MALSPQEKALFEASLMLKNESELKSLFNKLSLEKDGCWTPEKLRREATEKHALVKRHLDGKAGKISFD